MLHKSRSFSLEKNFCELSISLWSLPVNWRLQLISAEKKVAVNSDGGLSRKLNTKLKKIIWNFLKALNEQNLADNYFVIAGSKMNI